MRVSRIVVVFACLLPLAGLARVSRDLTVEQMQRERRVALVIGNSAYSFGRLRNPVNDANGFAAALRSCGFHVTVRTDEDRRDMYESIREFGRDLQAGGVGLFYYAGHAMQMHGRNYLIPVDADIQAADEVEFQALDALMVLRKMEAAENRINIVILDACRDNPFARSFRSVERGLVRMATATGSVIAYSTAPGEVAADGDGANGLYTSSLLEHITRPGIRLEQLFKAVRRDVMRKSSDAQVPWEASSLTGDFYFILPAGSPGGNAPAAAFSPPSDEGPSDASTTSAPGYSYSVSLGGMWPETKELGRIFSQDADAKILSEPAPVIDIAIERMGATRELRSVKLSFLLAFPKSQPTPDSYGGHKGFLATALVEGVRPLPWRLISRSTYLVGGAGFWVMKFSRSRVDDALDINPGFRLGVGTHIWRLGHGDVGVEVAYLPLKGPTYVVNSVQLMLRCDRGWGKRGASSR